MRPTVGQLSSRTSAGSSRFAKSVASTIVTSDGRPDAAPPVHHAGTLGAGRSLPTSRSIPSVVALGSRPQAVGSPTSDALSRVPGCASACRHSMGRRHRVE
jgi:hypothetical protein